jgi:hypothetical protein
MNRLRTRNRAVGGGGDADVSTWQAAVIANGGTVSAGTLAAVTAFTASAKASGYWTKLLRLNLFCGDQLAAALVPLKVGGGNATDTNVNFVGGDYAEATGLTGGATKYLRTGIIPSTMLTTNSTHLSVYNRAGSASGGGCAVGATSGGGILILYAPTASGLAESYQYGTGAGLVSVAVTAPYGLITGSRTAVDAHALYKGATSIGSNATALNALPIVELYVMGRNANGVLSEPTQHAIAGYSIGAGLTAGEVAAYAGHMETFQDALGRGVI